MKTIPFKLGVITDEVSQNIFEAAEFAKKHGLQALEIRSVNDHAPYDLTAEDLAEIKKAAQENGLEIAAISSPLFKCDFENADEREAHIQGFKKCIRIAKELGAKLIRGFDFWENGVSLADRAEAYRPIAELCDQEDMLCVIEFDPSVHSSTPHKVAELVEAINHPRIKGLFDPGNTPFADQSIRPYPDGYEALQPHIRHIHIKDPAVTDGKVHCIEVGTGKLVDYKGLFRRLLQENYNGYVMLETHYRKNVVLTEEQLKRPGGAAFSEGVYSASEESILGLKKIIREITEE